MTVALVTRCQSCSSPDLELVVSLGQLPLVNDFRPVSAPLAPQTFYPHEMLWCPRCDLVQLGIEVPPEECFPASYPYTSSTTRVLRENFTNLYRETTQILDLPPHALVIDIGGNDGNLLSNFTAHRTLNVTPEDIGKLGEERGIPHLQRYWSKETAAGVLAHHGKARVIAATNVFAHVPDPHGFVEAMLDVLTDDGLLVFECQYLGDLLQLVQFDHLYAEHRRFYSLQSLRNLLAPHGLTVFSASRIPTHGGSFRAFAARKPPGPYGTLFEESPPWVGACSREKLRSFAVNVAEAKRDMWSLLAPYGRVVGIGAPSRSATLINYVGIDHSLMPYVCETAGSHKLDHWMPGTRIPVCLEDRLFNDEPGAAMLLSWHLGSELADGLRRKGYRGDILMPLPEAKVMQ